MGERANRLRNILGAALAWHGWTGMMAGLFLSGPWYEDAPTHPDPAHGATLLRSNHGSDIYLTAFQSTAHALLLLGGTALFAAGFVLLPKANPQARTGFLSFFTGWEFDDPHRMARWGAAAGVALTLVMLVGWGPPLVRWLNATGVVLNY
jgi:hypothetical protein